MDNQNYCYEGGACFRHEPEEECVFVNEQTYIDEFELKDIVLADDRILEFVDLFDDEEMFDMNQHIKDAVVIRMDAEKVEAKTLELIRLTKLRDQQAEAVQMAEEIVMATEGRIKQLEDIPLEDVCVDAGYDIYGNKKSTHSDHLDAHHYSLGANRRGMSSSGWFLNEAGVL